MTDPLAPAERALTAARQELTAAGSPAHLAVVVLPDRCEVGAIVHAGRQPAAADARRLAAEAPSADCVLVVSMHRERDRVRFVVTAPVSEEKLLVRSEVAGDVIETPGGWI